MLVPKEIPGLFGKNLPAVADPDNQDDEPGFMLLENYPIGSDTEPVKRLLRAAKLLYVVFQCGRIAGED